MISKVANTYQTLQALGDLHVAAENLKMAKRTVEAEVIEKISDIIEGELDPNEMEKATDLALEKTAAPVVKPMTMSQKTQLRRKMKMHKPRTKLWLCCTRPKKMMTHGKTHKAMWLSTCKYKIMSGKLKGQTRSMKLVVGRDPKKAPRQITRKGKRVRWC